METSEASCDVDSGLKLYMAGPEVTRKDLTMAPRTPSIKGKLRLRRRSWGAPQLASPEAVMFRLNILTGRVFA